MPGRITGNGTDEDPIRTEGLDDLQPRFMVVSPKMKEGLEVLAERERCLAIVMPNETLIHMCANNIAVERERFAMEIRLELAARIREGT